MNKIKASKPSSAVKKLDNAKLAKVIGGADERQGRGGSRSGRGGRTP